MAKGYWIARIDVKDPETYKSYIAAATPSYRNMAPNSWSEAGNANPWKAQAAPAMW
jgi:uncharacterized protein (DUF1330 family)